mmetsp:Transcript_45621/g.108590  ORF Transcript_45621/g.108590 Transcript_45621/m.108590 type:complete len:406 (-) Transcript_45621:238-1455(-)|eukprot:CAMPEP_0178432066 /NCGR_PEP_ID=MMETSP0689_2-20121128/32186_1 /TAXON_ID=160604 /ORGANISM="Amphidinium massartii, Strain CS-259" /LENGTH=405 /DNA_ID=CAMNT_0020054027 /DNA_START=69 /DNA_END=1286 /DNA_ORIENTATION=-
MGCRLGCSRTVVIKVQQVSPTNADSTASSRQPLKQQEPDEIAHPTKVAEKDEPKPPEANTGVGSQATQATQESAATEGDIESPPPHPPESLPVPNHVPLPEDEEVKPVIAPKRSLTEEALRSENLKKRSSSFRGASFHSLSKQHSMDIDPEKMGGSRPLGQAFGRPFPKRPIGCKLSAKAWVKLEEFFRKMDLDHSNAVTREEARAFFKGAFATISAEAMFNEVDVDGSGAITAEEFVAFWIQVRKSGYKDQDVLDELDELIQGGAWVDWKDGRKTDGGQQKRFPRRPIFSRLSNKCWKKCEELFNAMDTDHGMVITRLHAEAFFKGAFSNISVQAMFNEIDENQHGSITADEWMAFWAQVRSSGYSNKDIIDELDNMLDGSCAWVDWKDGRKTAGGKQGSVEIS